MKLRLLKSNIDEIKKDRILLIKLWLGNTDVLSILKKYNIEIDTFVKTYALGIISHHFKIFEGLEKVGDCPVIESLVKYLSQENIIISELFTICNGFKKALTKIALKNCSENLDIMDEIDYVHELNFAYILDKYSKSLIEMKDKLHKSSKIIDNYLITARISANGKILHVSKAFCRASGYTSEELLQSKNDILNHMDMPKDFLNDFNKAMEDRKSFSAVIKSLRKDGKAYWVDAVISPLFDDDNELLFFDLISYNITSKKKLEKQQSILIEQSKLAAMGEMVSMIAHQWRQPLQAVSIMSNKLLITKSIDGDISKEVLEQTVDKISQQLEYMSSTIDDFRDFFLPNKMKQSISMEQLFKKVLDFLSFMTKNQSIKINIKISVEESVDLYVNETVQVIINIINNAKDVFNERNIEKKIININCYKLNDFLIIEVEDNAGGIEENIKEKIFDPYFSTKKKMNGTGLGLYMSKMIVEKHSQGRLSVENSKLGAKFKITLPFHK